jgi:uncharacterized protein with von Willebrand factor type A (vWA) domain
MNPDVPGAPGGRAAPVPADLALVAARFGAALRTAGVPADPGRCERFAYAVTVARPPTLRGLYLCALATLASSQDHIETLQRVFWEVFGGPADLAPVGDAGRPGGLPGGLSRAAPAAGVLHEAAEAARAHGAQVGRPAAERFASEPAGDDRDQAGGPLGADGRRRLVPLDGATPEGEDAQAARHTLASAVERLASTDFAELSPAELLLLSGLMHKLTLAVPPRRSRRTRRTPHGRQTDLRTTLRQARRTGGHPLRLARHAPLLEPRRLVVLCDISGSMEPYARAMLQLLYCAAGGARAEVFTFATRLTRLTGTLAHARPGVALQQAGRAAPDWLGGTRIGESLAEFNNSYGRRGMARGAVVVVISDGWDTGDPAVLSREMERLSRVAHRIIWVNPRTQSPEYQPLAGGMAAAWPYCDAVVSAHSLNALDDLTAALAHSGRRP